MPYILGDMTHFTGESVVWRGPWHIDVPLDFELYINPEEDENLKEKAAMVISQFIAQNYVCNLELEAATLHIDEQENEER